MTQNFRHPEILEIARTEGKVLVEELSERFGVSLQTIRRDLTELADAGALTRVHGGAVLPSGTSNIEYEDRQVLNEPSKRAMAEVCSQLIPDGASLFLNIGTTTEAVAQSLRSHVDLLVVTNNMNVATIVSPYPECELVLTGGNYRRSDGGLTGALTVQTIQAFKFDIAVIGCSALDADGDLLDFDISEVSVSQTIIERSRKVILVADSSKFHRNAPARIASLSAVDVFVTDRPLEEALWNRCQDWNTEVLVVGPLD